MTMQLLLGCCLEFVHGTLRVGLLYILGVVTGSLTALVVTPNTMLVGASGGDFCLIAAVIANVVLNRIKIRNPEQTVAPWGQFRFASSS